MSAPPHSMVSTLAACAVAVACPLAQADDPAATATLGTVSVTGDIPSGFTARSVQVGTFRDQNLLDVPLTVDVIPREMLDAQDARGLYDALRNTAGVSRWQTNGTVSDTLAIRGVFVENRTNYRLNGALPVNNLIDMPLENKERVEVLKGASSLYYGFSTPVGVVNLVTKRARNTPNASFSLSGNEYGQALAHLDVGSKFGADQQFGARANVVAGSLRNGIDGVKGDRDLFSLALDWRASQRLSFRFDFEQFHKTITEQAIIVMPAAVNGKISLPALPDASRLLSGGSWTQQKAGAQNLLLRADYALSEQWALLAEVGRAKTVRNQRNYSEIRNINPATGEGVMAYYLYRDPEFTNENARVELTGHFASGPLAHELSLGVMRNKRYASTPGTQQYTTTQNLYNPRPIAELAYTAATKLNPIRITDDGFYLFDRLRLGDDWQVVLGARRENYRNQKDTNGVRSTYKVSPDTYAFSTMYRLRPDTSVYASYIEGLEETGIASAGLKNAGEILEPAISKQQEIGLRTAIWPGSLASLAYFQLERATVYDKKMSASDALLTRVVDGRTELKGLEVSLSADLGRQVSLHASGLLMQARLSRAADPNMVGKTPDATPERSFSLFGEYRPVAVPGLSLNAGAYYTGKRPLDNLNQGWLPGYTLYSLGARYTTRIAGKNTTLQLNLDNAGNKQYWSAAGQGYLSVGVPRTLSMNVKMDW